eukprot:243459-Rhodomonas_salina.1
MASEAKSANDGLCELSYVAWSDFEILNEIDLPVHVRNCEPGKAELLWANKAFLKASGKSLGELRKVDMTSDGAQKHFEGIYQTVQLDRQVSVAKKVVLPFVCVLCMA